MFFIHYITNVEGSFGMYGYDERNHEFLASVQEITVEQYNIDKHEINETNICIEYKSKFYSIQVSLVNIFGRNITEECNDNEIDKIIDQFHDLINSEVELEYIGKIDSDFGYGHYMNPVHFIIMSGMITASI